MLQAHGIAAETGGQVGAALHRAVGDGQLPRPLRGEVRGAEFDHFAGADEEDFLFRQAVEDARRKMHRRGGHGNRVGADRGGRADFLGHREGALEQLAQQRADGSGFFGNARRLLHLAEDLRLAQHHRIQPRRDAEHVAHGFLLRMLVKIGLDLLRRQRVIFGQPVRRTLRVFGRAIQLGAVAGGQNRRFAHGLGPQQVVQGLTHARRIERHLLANRERGRMVIDAQSEQLHGDMTLKRDEKFRQGVLETDRAQTTRRRQEGRTPAGKPEPRLSHRAAASAASRDGHLSGRGAACAGHHAPPAKVREATQTGKIPRFRAARQ